MKDLTIKIPAEEYKKLKKGIKTEKNYQPENIKNWFSKYNKTMKDPKYKALFCLTDNERMTESEINSDEAELLRKQWHKEDFLIIGPAMKYTCPKCKSEIIGVEAQNKATHAEAIRKYAKGIKCDLTTK